jgi:hypothetical protein
MDKYSDSDSGINSQMHLEDPTNRMGHFGLAEEDRAFFGSSIIAQEGVPFLTRMDGALVKYRFHLRSVSCIGKNIISSGGANLVWWPG